MICAACGQGLGNWRPNKCYGCSNPIMASDQWRHVKVRGVCTPMHVNCGDGERNG
jgi:hypothetical protein